MAQYIPRKGRAFYELAKFEDSDTPTAVYLFTKRGCSCPGSRRGCKHVKILNTWKLGKEVAGQVYDDAANLLTTLRVN